MEQLLIGQFPYKHQQKRSHTITEFPLLDIPTFCYSLTTYCTIILWSQAEIKGHKEMKNPSHAVNTDIHVIACSLTTNESGKIPGHIYIPKSTLSWHACTQQDLRRWYGLPKGQRSIQNQISVKVIQISEIRSWNKIHSAVLHLKINELINK